ncbi:hypothetical protein KVA01_23040 [Kocuria varians]|uniref:Uncharacterized protein n=1 Tax=Kocuria varians TaxID=1272 RepID=A0A4Y4D852_KOCVA|nr:hypothetical protein KVA01_23040 [Kocuria varians]
MNDRFFGGGEEGAAGAVSPRDRPSVTAILGGFSVYMFMHGPCDSRCQYFPVQSSSTSPRT